MVWTCFQRRSGAVYSVLMREWRAIHVTTAASIHSDHRELQRAFLRTAADTTCDAHSAAASPFNWQSTPWLIFSRFQRQWSHASHAKPHVMQMHSAASNEASGSAGGTSTEQREQDTQPDIAQLIQTVHEYLERNELSSASALLENAIGALQDSTPPRPELGDLQSAMALTRRLQDKSDAAVTHAALALQITRQCCPNDSRLRSHRHLQLGQALLAEGLWAQAAQQLHTAFVSVQDEQDPLTREASFYLTLCLLPATDKAKADLAGTFLLSDLKCMLETSPRHVATLAVKQHARVIGHTLSRADVDPLLCKELLKQHVRVASAVDAQGVLTASALHRLATYEYVQGFFPDALSSITKALTMLRALETTDTEDMVRIYEHRQGMICAAGGEHVTAKRLLTLSCQRWTEGEEAPAAHVDNTDAGVTVLEARVGLALAELHALDSSASEIERQEALNALLKQLTAFQQAVGQESDLCRVLNQICLYMQARHPARDVTVVNHAPTQEPPNALLQ